MKPRFTRSFFIILFFLYLQFQAQPLNAQSYSKQKANFALFNIGFNGLVGGAGALVNKRPNEKGLKVFWKGFTYGAIGGSVTYFGKNLTYQIYRQKKPGLAWPAKLTASIGNSITQNAASNIPFWEKWHMHLGFARLEYNFKQNHFKARIIPATIATAIAFGNQGNFNLKKSLQTGILYFEKDGSFKAIGLTAKGVGVATSIGISNDIDSDEYHSLLAHEMMHILQYEGAIWINPFFNEANKNWKRKSRVYDTLSKYLYFDWNGPILLSLYLAQKNKRWHCRFLEREAEHFSRRATLFDCK